MNMVVVLNEENLWFSGGGQKPGRCSLFLLKKQPDDLAHSGQDGEWWVIWLRIWGGTEN